MIVIEEEEERTRRRRRKRRKKKEVEAEKNYHLIKSSNELIRCIHGPCMPCKRNKVVSAQFLYIHVWILSTTLGDFIHGYLVGDSNKLMYCSMICPESALFHYYSFLSFHSYSKLFVTFSDGRRLRMFAPKELTLFLGSARNRGTRCKL